MDNLSGTIEAAEEEFASLKEKVELVCDCLKRPIYNRQMRKPNNWGGQRHIENNQPVYCFAISHRPWSLRADNLSRDELKSFIIKIFILVPEHCSLYHFANFIASSEGIACVAANSKIYLFGGGCGTRVWYMDVVGKGDEQGKEWNQAEACFNREKCNPLSFSLGNKIYALETLYLPMSNGLLVKRDGEVYSDDDYWFEVLDTSTDGSRWLPLCNPPFPFGACQVLGSWSSDSSGDQGDGYRIFIDAYSLVGGYHLFVYDVDTNTWDKFKRRCPENLVHYPSIRLDYHPFYSWAIHSIGKDFAPFPPHVPYTGDLRVLTGLKRSIPQLHQLTSECEKGLSLPFPVKVETDRKEKVTVPCKKSSGCLTGWDLESLWTLHCLPVESVRFWQAIHLGGSSFCTLAYHSHSFCCSKHTYMYVRVANFDISDAAAGGSTEPVLSAEYGANKAYLLSEAILASPLPCSKLQPI